MINDHEISQREKRKGRFESSFNNKQEDDNFDEGK